MIKDLVNKKFGYLRVVRAVGRRKRAVLWLCQCSCGQEVAVRSDHLTDGSTKSCGCRLANNGLRHGQARRKKTTGAYRSFQAARYRCNNPNDHYFHRYGGRGIKVLFKDFQEFFAEIGPRPDGYTLDRIDNGGHYAPGNVRWATPRQQRLNQ